MTRDEFIDGYIARSKYGAAVVRRPLGFSTPGGGYLALPCLCDYEACEGWAILPDSLSTVLLHCELSTPENFATSLTLRCTKCGHQWTMAVSKGILAAMFNCHEATGYCCTCGNRDPLSIVVTSYT